MPCVDPDFYLVFVSYSAGLLINSSSLVCLEKAFILSLFLTDISFDIEFQADSFVCLFLQVPIDIAVFYCFHCFY